MYNIPLQFAPVPERKADFADQFDPVLNPFGKPTVIPESKRSTKPKERKLEPVKLVRQAALVEPVPVPPRATAASSHWSKGRWVLSDSGELSFEALRESPIKAEKGPLRARKTGEIKVVRVIQVDESLDTIADAFRLFGCKAEEVPAGTRQHWQNMTAAASGNWMKVVKYKTNAFFSHHKQQPQPSPPWPPGAVQDRADTLLGGAFYRWFKLLRKDDTEAGRERLEEFVETIHQGVKRGCPRPTAEMLREAERQHVTKMTAEPEQMVRGPALLPWDMIGANFPMEIPLTATRATAEAQLRRTVRELFGRKRYTFLDRCKPFFPSVSANYIRSRAMGGALSEILEHPILLDGLRTPGGPFKVRVEKSKEEEEAKAPGMAWLSEQTQYDTDDLESRFRELWLRLLRLTQVETNLVEPVGLAESLKVRVITKGPPLRQTVLRSLRKFLHDTLRRHPVFELIGTPVTEEIMTQQLGPDLLRDEEYLSGDFEGATDNVHSWASDCVADELADVLDIGQTERKLFRESLTGHLYPQPQRRGQLMGSITSFPVLCIINATATRWSIEIAEEKELSLLECKMLINGDDVAVKAHKRLYGVWRPVTRLFGLIESVGKTFSSENFVEINSRQFRRITHTETTIDIERKVITQREIGEFRVTKFVNMGLVKGYKRSQGTSIGLNDQDDPNNNLGRRARQLIAESPSYLHAKLMPHFIRLHKDVLRPKDPKTGAQLQIPWYIPEWLGGFGLPFGQWGGPSELDLRVAHAILLNWKKERPTSLAHDKGTWRTWQIAEQRMPEAKLLEQEGPLTKLYDNVSRLQIYNLLFDSDVGMSELAAISRPGGALQAILKNNRLWSPARQSKLLGGPLPKPLAVEDLIFKKRFPALPPTLSTEARAIVDGFRVGQLFASTETHTGATTTVLLD